MKRSYLDYAMSVIVSRALPDVRDGLKPVQRRILYAMRANGYDIGKPHRKSALIVGDVMGKYHPHGDSAIYDAMVRLAQPWSMRLMLIDGQGNFGSMDNDPPAAMRYTEARLARPAAALLDDIDKDTVDWRPNYDESINEPTVLPAQFPHLLVNGAGGIAVGMATNIPPHNLGEIIDAALLLIDQPDLDVSELMDIVQGPDFPTGGIILGRAGIHQAYSTGRGTVVIRSKCHFEEVRKDRQAIIVTECPFQVNKARLVERIAEVVKEKRVEGISDLRDESDRQGVRVVIEVRRDADPDVVLNQLYKFTPLQTSFGINMVALNGGRPEIMTLTGVLKAFLDFRELVITRRTAFDLGKARDRAHVLAGLAVAVANIDDIIALIRHAPDPAAAKAGLLEKAWPADTILPLLRLVERQEEGAELLDTYQFTDVQAQAILDLRLHRLTGLEREKIGDELQEIAKKIAELLEILENRDRLLEVMRAEMTEVRDKFADPRRTFIDLDAELDIDIEDLIPREEMVVTVTHLGYIKRVPLSTFRAQRRGGKGKAGMKTHEDDFVSQMFVTSTHTPVLFFSSLGRVYKLKVYKLPLGNPQARGKAMINLFPHLSDGENITAILPLPEDEESWADLSAFFATAQGKVRRNALSDFTRVPVNGKIAMGLDESDKLVGVDVCDDSHDILLAMSSGKAIRFTVDSIRVFKSRSSEGVRGVTLHGDDEVISMTIVDHIDMTPERRDDYQRNQNALKRQEITEPNLQLLTVEEFTDLQEREQFLLTITINGFGKRTSAYEYRVTNRGGQGIINIETSDRNGKVAATFPVTELDQIMLTTNKGKVIRTPVDQIRIAGRNTQGVKIFTTDPGEFVVSAARLNEPEEDETLGEEEL